MKTRTTITALALLLPLGAGPIQAEGPSGAALAFTCAGCHGTDGSSVGPSSPSIAAMDPEVLIDAMNDYRMDQRNSTIMNRIGKGYGDEQIMAMAWFFAKQPLRTRPQTTIPRLVSLGRDLHDEYCGKCHEEDGRPGDAGTLAGQWMSYLYYAMADFISGKREYPRKMQPKVDAAIEVQGDQAMPALLHYYASQSSAEPVMLMGAGLDENGETETPKGDEQ